MDNPFFLTRQTANLMEDFARELEKGSTLYLLYGEPRVGKTRLLEELQHTRLGDKAVHWIDLANAPEDLASADLSREIEDLFGQAAQGDVIIADHFELALKKTRHQLFLSWSTDGVDKGLNLIVASNLEGFNELRQLSQQYQVRVQSFQLMPLDGDEVEAFLGHYLFPNHPLGKLTMPAPLKRQVAEARGVIGSLIEIADHDGSHIETAPLADTETLRSGSRVIVAVLALFALAVGVGWYFFVEPEPSLVEIAQAPAPAPAAATNDAVEVAESPEPAAAVDAIEATQAADESADDASAASRAAGESVDVASEVATGGPPPASEPDPDADAADSSTPVPAEADGSAGVAESGSSEAGANIAQDTTPLDAPAESAPDTSPADAVSTLSGSDSAPVIDQSIDAAATAQPIGIDAATSDDAAAGPTTLTSVESQPPVPAASADLAPQDRLLRELKHSLDWLYAGDETFGTIQVLLLGFDNFDPDGYFDYVADLGRKQVDTGQLRIVKTFTGGKVVYSVFYGEYESRRAALRAIDDLPESLLKAGPIPRSLGGIWQEIRRLPAEN